MCRDGEMVDTQFPFKHGDYIQHISETGDRFIVRLVDNLVFEAYAENIDDEHGTRIINPNNWKKIPKPIDRIADT